MRDWKRYVRRRMPDLPVATQRLAAIEQELAEHLANAYEEARASGASHRQAERQARELFDWELLERELRQVENLSARQPRRCRSQEKRAASTQKGLARAPDSLARDLRFGLRSLLKTPALTLTIVLTVGLGIGASSAIFGVINGVLLRPLPYPGADRLVRVYTDHPPYRFPLSVADYRALEEQQTSFTGLAGYRDASLTLAHQEAVERIAGKFVTPAYFQLLGIKPLHGRLFSESDGLSGAEPTVIVSHGFWTRHLEGDVQAMGRTVKLDGHDYTVVGVLPPQVGPLEQDREFFAAVQWQPPPRRGPFFITALARLREGVDRAGATQELRAINRRIFPLWQSSYQDRKASWAMMSLEELVVGDVGQTLVVVLAAVGFLLLIASTNAANLLLARALSRRRELAGRGALGASRGRIVQQLMCESGLLALASALVGLALASSGIRLVTALGRDFIPRTSEVSMDGNVVAFLGALTALSALLLGLAPALEGAGCRLEEALRSGGRSATHGAGVRRLRRALVVAQFAVSVPLLIGAGLLAGSLSRLLEVDPGFDPRNILTAGISLPARSYPETSDVLTFWERVQERIRALPGVEAAALANARPPRDARNINNFDLEDRPTPPNQSQPAVPWITVTPGYFKVYGVRLVRGRLFHERDGDGTADPVAIVDEAWARRFFPDEDVLGRRFREGGRTEGPFTQVVGVVEDVKYLGLDHPGEGAIYSPMLNDVNRSSFLVIRTSTPPESLLSSLRAAVRELDPTLPLSPVATAEELMGDSIRRPRYLTILVSAFAAVAVLLSVVGIYGVMSHFVQQHTRDIGIQMALGGGPARVLRQVVGRGMQLVGLGVILGLAAALALTRYMTSLLYGISATDLPTYVTAATLMLAAAATACFLPARRAAGLDPAMTLRQE